jgi:magnesium chelatase family protein
VSLAHNGVLFLDELPEFNRNVLEVLRQPLEDGIVTISRAKMSVTYPARFMLVAAMNPCPCGYLTDPYHECTCTPSMIQRYHAKVSGPLLDRIDIHIEVPPLRFDELRKESEGEPSSKIRERVEKAREIQLKRYANLKGIHSNSQIGPKEIKKYCRIDRESEQLLRTAIEKFGFSSRAYHRILKVARTIADLEESVEIQAHHVAEAIQYRALDRSNWFTGVIYQKWPEH